MKTYILKLETNDDLISVRDKMGWAKNSRILIVWPEDGELLNRKLDLILLQRHSQKLGSPLALVSRDPEIRYQALRLGIPVYSTLQKAQDPHWRLPHRFRRAAAGSTDIENLRKDHPAFNYSRFPREEPRDWNALARLVFFAAGVFSLVAIAAILVPSARVSLNPQTMVQDVLLDAATNPEIEELNLMGAVPSELVSVEVEGRDAIPVSGTITLPFHSAEGHALFTNLSDQEVDIPQGSVVRPLGKSAQRYATIQDSVAPAGPGQTVEIEVRSVVPGSQGNLEAGSLVAIEGLLGTFLSVSNPNPIRGGDDRLEPAPTEQDRAELADRLENALVETARAEIGSQLASGDILIKTTLKPVETLEKIYQPEIEQPADQLTLSWRLVFEARIVRYEDMYAMVTSIFDANLASGTEPVPESLQIEVIDQPLSDEKSMTTWKLHAVRQARAVFSESQAVQLALGLPPEDAARRLFEALPLEETPRISLQPAWWPRMPILPFRIQVITAPFENASGEENRGS
jgi:hypothetical protein